MSQIIGPISYHIFLFVDTTYSPSTNNTDQIKWRKNKKDHCLSYQGENKIKACKFWKGLVQRWIMTSSQSPCVVYGIFLNPVIGWSVGQKVF